MKQFHHMCVRPDIFCRKYQAVQAHYSLQFVSQSVVSVFHALAYDVAGKTGSLHRYLEPISWV